MIHFLLFLLAASGFAMLCLARDRHQRDFLGRKLAPAAARWLLTGGSTCLLLAYPLAGFQLGWTSGTVEWFGQLSVGALVIVLLLARLSARKSPSR